MPVAGIWVWRLSISIKLKHRAPFLIRQYRTKILGGSGSIISSQWFQYASGSWLIMRVIAPNLGKACSVNPFFTGWRKKLVCLELTAPPQPPTGTRAISQLFPSQCLESQSRPHLDAAGPACPRRWLMPSSCWACGWCLLPDSGPLPLLLKTPAARTGLEDGWWVSSERQAPSMEEQDSWRSGPSWGRGELCQLAAGWDLCTSPSVPARSFQCLEDDW